MKCVDRISAVDHIVMFKCVDDKKCNYLELITYMAQALRLVVTKGDEKIDWTPIPTEESPEGLMVIKLAREDRDKEGAATITVNMQCDDL